MKRVLCALTLAALLLCCMAVAETKVIRPMYDEIDLAQPADGIYYVAFEITDIADGMRAPGESSSCPCRPPGSCW